MAYDWLKERRASKAAKEYLNILHLAARQNESMVDYALKDLIDKEQPITIESVTFIIDSLDQIPFPAEVTIEKVDLGVYDALLSLREEVQPCYQMN